MKQKPVPRNSLYQRLPISKSPCLHVSMSQNPPHFFLCKSIIATTKLKGQILTPSLTPLRGTSNIHYFISEKKDSHFCSFRKHRIEVQRCKNTLVKNNLCKKCKFWKFWKFWLKMKILFLLSGNKTQVLRFDKSGWHFLH